VIRDGTGQEDPAALASLVRDDRAEEARARIAAAWERGEDTPALRLVALLLGMATPRHEAWTPESLAPLLRTPLPAEPAGRLAGALNRMAEAPGAEFPRIEAACLLLQAEEPHWAEQAMLPLWPEGGTGPLFARVLSGIWAVLGRQRQAVEAAEAAVRLDPRAEEYLIHLAGLRLQQGAPGAALLAAGRAIGLAPEHAVAWRMASAAHLALGQVEEAIAASRRAASLSADQVGFAEEVLVSSGAEALNREHAPPPVRVEAPIRETPAWARLPASLPPPPRAMLGTLLRTRARIVDALMLREARTQFTHSRLGYAWALFEPITHVFILFVAIGIMGGSRAPIGDSLPVFYMTGVLPYLFFCHVTERGMHIARDSRVLLSVPVVTLGDIAAARLLLRAATDVVVFLVTLTAFIAMGIAQLPNDPLSLLAAYVVLFVLACGIALANMVLSELSELPERVWTVSLRGLYFVSGIFYHPNMMPAGIREWVLWNPLIHAVEWVRQAYYPLYVSPYLDVEYLLRWALATLLLGGFLVAGFHRRLRGAT
jgi:capsular polysaccharide transport system permease protein